jgi:hypothetical protein
VAALKLIGCGTHAFGEEALQVRMDGAVLLGDDVPAWLRPPGGSSDFRIEQVGSWWEVGRSNELLFLLGQIACETLDAFRKQPDTSVGDFDRRRRPSSGNWIAASETSHRRPANLGSCARVFLQDFADFVVFCLKSLQLRG